MAADEFGAWPEAARPESVLTVAMSDETTPITAGAAKVSLRTPFPMTLTRTPTASLSAAGSGPTVADVHVEGVSILGPSKLQVDASAKTSVTTLTPTSLAVQYQYIPADAEMTFDIDTAGAGARGLKVSLFFKQA